MSTANFKTGTLFTRDNLYILKGMNSETIDLVYLDPLFNGKKNYNEPCLYEIIKGVEESHSKGMFTEKGYLM